ncbi:DUF58 domain-containing protein [Thermodesulfovibrio sp.]|uniref:DUF58 domain-containing protein n=1 Tax=Thermodesulfovibrio sp. TaxID=2067987 RepID=UPI0030B6F21A
MAISGILSFFNLKNLQILIEPPAEIFALKTALFRVTAKNKSPYAKFLLRIKIFDKETVIPYLKDKETFNIGLTFSTRGIHKLEKITVSSYFPFYFFRRANILNYNLQITVFPHPIKCEIPFLISNSHERENVKSSRDFAYEGDLSGVRTYKEGDPLKYIHWKASAKTTSLKTKELSPFMTSSVIINLDDFSGSLEEKIGKATYAIIAISKNGNPVGLKTKEAFFKAQQGKGHIRKMLYFLSTYEENR